MTHEAKLTSVKSNIRHKSFAGYEYVDLPFLIIVVRISKVSRVKLICSG